MLVSLADRVPNLALTLLCLLDTLIRRLESAVAAAAATAVICVAARIPETTIGSATAVAMSSNSSGLMLFCCRVCLCSALSVDLCSHSLSRIESGGC